MKFCPKLSRCHPGIGIPAVGILSVVHRILFSDIVDRLRHLAARDTVTKHFHPAGRLWLRRQEICAVIHGKSVERHRMAGIHALEQHQFMPRIRQLLRNLIGFLFSVIQKADAPLHPV